MGWVVLKVLKLYMNDLDLDLVRSNVAARVMILGIEMVVSVV